MSGTQDSDEKRDGFGKEGGEVVYRSRGGGTDHLRAAQTYLGAKDGSGGSEPWTVKGWPVVRERQIALLRDWAHEEGLWIPAESLGEIQRGRMEHDLFLIGTDDERVGKITKGAGFGRHPFCEDLVSGMISDWFQARPGSPFQYLERLELVNAGCFPG